MTSEEYKDLKEHLTRVEVAMHRIEAILQDRMPGALIGSAERRPESSD